VAELVESGRARSFAKWMDERRDGSPRFTEPDGLEPPRSTRRQEHVAALVVTRDEQTSERLVHDARDATILLEVGFVRARSRRLRLGGIG